MLATPNNMREYAQPGLFAYDPDTGDRFSATHGDYFWQAGDKPLTNESGSPLVLATETCDIERL